MLGHVQCDTRNSRPAAEFFQIRLGNRRSRDAIDPFVADLLKFMAAKVVQGQAIVPWVTEDKPVWMLSQHRHSSQRVQPGRATTPLRRSRYQGRVCRFVSLQKYARLHLAAEIAIEE